MYIFSQYSYFLSNAFSMTYAPSFHILFTLITLLLILRVAGANLIHTLLLLLLLLFLILLWI